MKNDKNKNKVAKSTNKAASEKKKKAANKPVLSPEEKKAELKRTILSIPVIIVAGLIYSFGFETFASPNKIAPGGATGLAVALAHVTNLSDGVIYLMINFPILIIGFIFLGKKMMFKTLLSVSVISVATDYIFSLVPNYVGDKLLAAVFGGVLMGAGLGLCYRFESTSGGTDIIIKLLNKMFPQASLGMASFMTELVIISIATAIFGEIETALYALIALFMSSKTLDLFVYGSYEGKMLLIVSDEYEAIAQKIISVGRGVTYLKGESAYTGNDKQVICCAVHKNEYIKMKRYIKEIDPKAFIIISSVKEVLGEGFQKI